MPQLTSCTLSHRSLPFHSQKIDSSGGSMSSPVTTPNAGIPPFSSSSSSSITIQEMEKLANKFHYVLTTRANDIMMDPVITDFCSLSMSTSSQSSDFSSEGASKINCIREVEILPSDAITDLKSIADRMITAGYGRECAQVYITDRKAATDFSLRHLRIEELSINSSGGGGGSCSSSSNIHMLQWDVVLQSMINRWICTADYCIRVLFASECLLFSRVFESSNEYCGLFTETVIKEAAMQMFGFPYAISRIGHPPFEKLSTILDLHFAISDMLPDISVIFLSEPIIYSHASDILSRFAEAVPQTMSDFEDAILKNQSNIQDPSGSVHGLTKYVMNYIRYMSEYHKQTLIELIMTSPSSAATGREGFTKIDFPEPEENHSPFASHLIWIVAVLVSNLEDKAKLYKNEALSHFFLMNNVHYIVHKVRKTMELRELIGDNYLKKLTAKFQRLATAYRLATWESILHCLKGNYSSGRTRSRVKESLKSFNAAFDKVHQVQATWFVPDVHLREKLRISILDKLLLAYRRFIKRYEIYIKDAKHLELIVKYSADDIVTALSDFFEGRKPNAHSSTKSH